MAEYRAQNGNYQIFDVPASFVQSFKDLSTASSREDRQGLGTVFQSCRSEGNWPAESRHQEAAWQHYNSQGLSGSSRQKGITRLFPPVWYQHVEFLKGFYQKVVPPGVPRLSWPQLSLPKNPPTEYKPQPPRQMFQYADSDDEREFPIFDGKKSWRNWRRYLETIAVMDHWTERDCMCTLISSLRGDAAEHYADLPDDVRHDFRLLLQEFDEVYYEDSITSAIHAKPLHNESSDDFRDRILRYILHAQDDYGEHYRKMYHIEKSLCKWTCKLRAKGKR